MADGKPKKLPVHKNKAAMIVGAFVSMKIQGIQATAKKAYRTAQQRVYEDFRRFKERYGNDGWMPVHTAKRQAERITRQIAKGQLTESNGLVRVKKSSVQMSQVHEHPISTDGFRTDESPVS